MFPNTIKHNWLTWSAWPRIARSFRNFDSCASTLSRSRRSLSYSAAMWCCWNSCCFRYFSRCSLATRSCCCCSICCCWRAAMSLQIQKNYVTMYNVYTLYVHCTVCLEKSLWLRAWQKRINLKYFVIFFFSLQSIHKQTILFLLTFFTSIRKLKTSSL